MKMQFDIQRACRTAGMALLAAMILFPQAAPAGWAAPPDSPESQEAKALPFVWPQTDFLVETQVSNRLEQPVVYAKSISAMEAIAAQPLPETVANPPADEHPDVDPAIRPLSVHLQADSELVGPGEEVLVTGTVANRNNAPLQDVVLTVRLPVGLVCVPGRASGFEYSEPDRRLTWIVPEIGKAAEMSGSFAVRVEGLRVGESVTLVLTAEGGGMTEPLSATLTLPIVEPRSDDAWLTPDGGWFRSEDGLIALEVPPGAVKARTRFTYVSAPGAPTLPKLPVPQHALFALEAEDESGQPVRQFDAPLKLTYFFPPRDSASPVFTERRLFVFDEESGGWVAVPSEMDARKGQLTAALTHFSIYSEGGYDYIVEEMAHIRGAQTNLFSGSIGYRYGFKLLPGRGGLTPGLGLSYSSSRHTPNAGHFSHAGFGFEIAGADSIYRPPGDANADKTTLSLQGATYSLRQTDDNSWFAEENPFLKISEEDSGATFKVWTPDGTKYTFGGDSKTYYWKNCDSTPFKRYVRWPLTRIDSPNGNWITYTWATETENTSVWACQQQGDPVDSYERAVRLTAIEYNDSKTKVELGYGTRDDRPNGYDSADWRFYTEKKLTSVTVKVKRTDAAWKTVRTYNLSHVSGPATGVSQKVLNLDYIQESAGGNTLPRTVFSYTQEVFVAEDDFGAMKWVENGYGGKVTFDTENRGGSSENAHIVLTRTETSGISGAVDGIWTYSYLGWTEDQDDDELAKGWQQVDVSLPNGAQERHRFHTIQTASNGENVDHLAGREWRLRVSSGGSELKRMDTTWISSTADLPISGYSSMAEDQKPRFVYAEQIDTYLDAQIVNRQQLYYEKSRQGGSYQYGNVTQAREYDCSSGSCGAEPVRTTYTWYYPRTDGGRWVVNRPARTDFYKERAGAAGASLEGQTLLYYDQTTDYTTPPTNGQLRLRKTKLDGSNWAETEYTYWSNGNLRRVYDPNDHFTETFYDSWYQAFAVCEKNPVGHTTKTRYYGVPGSTDAGCATSDGSGVWSGGSPVQGRFFGKVEDVTDPNDALTAYEYDWWGRVTGVWRPGETKGSHSATELVDYTNYGGTTTPFKVRHRQRDDADGGGATATYFERWTFMDGLGRVIQTQMESATSGQIVLAHSHYDGQGRVVTDTLPYLKTATAGTYQTPDWSKPRRQFTYDGLGRVAESINPDGTKVRTYYSHVKTAVIDERNHQTLREADGLGRVVKVKQFTGTYTGNPGWGDTAYATAQYQYDVADRLTQVTDPGDDTTTITYDLGGRKTSMDDMDMGQWYYKYDLAGNLLTQVDARGRALCFYYDSMDRLTKKKDQGPVGTPSTYTCPTSEDSPDVTYTYDQGTYGKGRRTRMDYGTGYYATWTYDARGRVITDTQTIDSTDYTTVYAYDPADRVRRMTYPDGEQITCAYNTQGLLQSLTSSIGNMDYVDSTTYNALGQVTERWLGDNGIVRQRYTYDPNENFRLTALRSGTSPNYNNRQDISYTYDDTGNVLSIVDSAADGGSQTQSFGYDNLDRLTSAQATGGVNTYGPYSYAYNPAGNITSFQGTAFTYQDAAHKHGVTHLDGTQHYWYDANGNVTRRQNGGLDITLTYDAENRLSGVSNGVSASYVYDGDGVRVKATVNGVTTIYVGNHYEVEGGTVKKYYYANGVRIAERSGGTLYYLLTDHLGGTALTVSSGGVLNAELRYYPYGGTRRDSGTQVTTYRFTGQRWDSGTGLYHYGARWYDPLIGRFIQADTIVPDPSNPQDLNRYTYVRNNPVRYTDPTGYWTFEETPDDPNFSPPTTFGVPPYYTPANRATKRFMRTPLHLYHQFQGQGTRECGPAAIAIAYNAFWGSRGPAPSLSLEDVGREMDAGANRPRRLTGRVPRIPGGPTFPWGGEDYLESRRAGIPTAWHLRGGVEELKRNIDQNRISLVIIGEMKSRGTWAHYVLPYGYDDNTFYVVDPGIELGTRGEKGRWEWYGVRPLPATAFEGQWRVWGALIVELGK